MRGDDYKKREKLRRVKEGLMVFFLLLAGGYYLFIGRGQEAAALYSQTVPLQETAQADAGLAVSRSSQADPVGHAPLSEEGGGAARGAVPGELAPEMPDAWQGENGGSVRPDPDDGRVNINTAGMEELETLPGIGPATAQLIIEYRETYGGFAEIAEIQNVKRIGEKTFAKIKDLIKV